MNFTYVYLDLPPLPESIINQAYEACRKKEKTSFYNPNLFSSNGFDEWRDRVVKYKDGSYIKNTRSYRYWISEEFEKWIVDNVQEETQGSGVNIFEGGTLVAPHADNSRNYSIHYLLDSGGNAETVWYKEKNKNLIRSDLKHYYGKDHYIDYDNLEEIDRVCIPERTWVCLNGTILHAVENLKSPRIAIQISRDETPAILDKKSIKEVYQT
jgi:hypothetical protein